jgi:hypothetical protein
MSSNLELVRKIAWDYKHYEKHQVELPKFIESPIETTVVVVTPSVVELEINEH